MGSCTRSLHVYLLFIAISIFSCSQLTVVAWNPEKHNAEFTGSATDDNRSSFNGGSPTYRGFLDEGQEKYVEKMSGEENVGGHMKLLILEKVRLLLGLHNENGRSSVAAAARFGHGVSPSPAPAPAPVPAMASRFHHVPVHHFSPLPHPNQFPSLQDGHVLRRNNVSSARLLKVIIALVLSVVATMLVGGITVLSLCYRSRRNKRKRLEEMMLVTGFGGSKILDSSLSSTLHQKMSPTPSQQLFCSNSLETIQEDMVPIHKPTPASPDHKHSSPSSTYDRHFDSVSGGSGEIHQNAELPSLDEDDAHDHEESFHSVCNSDCSTTISSNASDAKHSNHSEVFSHSGFSNRSLSPVYKPPESVETNDLRSKSFPSHSFKEVDINPECSSSSRGSEHPVTVTLSSNPEHILLILEEDKTTSPVKTLNVNFPKPPPLPPSPALLNFSKPPADPPQYKTKSNFSQRQPPAPPCLFPPSSILTGKDGCPLPKLKPLHWDKVRATPDRSMAWDKIRVQSFELDEQMIESLFSYNLQAASANEGLSKTPSPTKHILEPKRLQNFTILLKALNATADQVCTSIMRGNGLSVQQLEALVRIEPTKEEAAKLSNYEGDVRELRPAEKIEACDELRRSVLFMRLLETVLRTGNRMNSGTIRGGARAFKLDALLKLADVKGTDGKTTLLHFVVQEVIRSNDDVIGMSPPNSRSDQKNVEEKRLELVTGLFTELCNVTKTATIDLELLATTVSNLSNGMEEIKRLIQDDLLKDEYENSACFVKMMDSFRIQGADVVKKLMDDEERVMIHVREITEYFHGNVNKDEANPLRIFVIVRDFLGMLDRVCKELGSSKIKHCLNRVMPF